MSVEAAVGWIHVMLDLPAESAEPVTTFWADALGWPLGEPWPGHPEFTSFTPPAGDAYVHRQFGDHGPRVHLDLEVADPAAARERLASLGADVGSAHPHWQVMSSPGGLPFCIVRRRPRSRPDPLEWGDGHRTRLVQVCVDSPAGRHEAEVAFWRAATGWRWVPGDAPEFAGKLYGAAGSPIQLLFQRLGGDDPGSSTRVHLDLGSDDIGADADRLVSLGAQLIGPGDGWIALRDPAGLSFCTTGNSPG
jgi:hypothetical protein